MQKVNTKVLFKKLYYQRALIALVIPGCIVIFIFAYLPMYGIAIAFSNYQAGLPILGAQWVGLKWFRMFLDDPYAWRIIRNTLVLGFYSIIFGFPAPILFALLLNELKSLRFKRTIQTISYLPHFISTIILVGILKEMTSAGGLINTFLVSSGYIDKPILFFSLRQWFRTLYVTSGIWQGVGWSSILYLAALSGIDQQLYEAARVDGANRFKQILTITIPSLIPTIIILFILSIGGLVGADFQKVLLMSSPQTYETADVIGTFVYRTGIGGGRMSYASAVGLLTSVFSFGLVVLTNILSKKATGTSLW